MVEYVVIDCDTGCHQLRYAAFHEFFCQFRILKLLAYRHTLAGSYELGQVGVECVVGKTGKLHVCLLYTSWKPEMKIIHPVSVVSEDDAPEYVDDLLSFARQFTGLRYRRGGKTPKGFDCSGFTGYVFRQFGVNLHADSRSQYLQGEAVAEGAMQPCLLYTSRCV